MIEGYFPGPGGRMAGPPAERPGPEWTDPVGQTPAEVVRLAARCARLEAVAEKAARVDSWGWGEDAPPGCIADFLALRAALSAAGAATDLCPICRQPWKVCDDCAPRPEGEW